ncbi:MAG TPA: hypothetical protein VEQ37_18125 [Actinomycetota bacterium]|nr:hypothetical protein [Actinomycetota bacterium]
MAESQRVATEEVEVGVTYAGAEGPFKRAYAAEVQVQQVKADVLEAFGLAETIDEAGNQTLYFLYRGGDKITDLSQTVGDLADHRKHLQLRLVREVIAGY